MPDKYVDVSHRLFLMYPNTVSVYELVTDEYILFKLMLETEEETIKRNHRSVFQYSPDGIDWIYLNLRDMLRGKPEGGDIDTATRIRNDFIAKVREMLKNTIPDVEMQYSDKDVTLHTRTASILVYDVSFVQHSHDDEPVCGPSVKTDDDFLQCSSETIEASHAALDPEEGTATTPRKSSRHDCVNYVPLDR